MVPLGMHMIPVPQQKQEESMYCGPTVLQMVLQHRYGEVVSQEYIAYIMGRDKVLDEGVTDIDLKDAAEHFGLDLMIEQFTQEKAERVLLDAPILAIAEMGRLDERLAPRVRGGHWYVLKGFDERYYYVNDPYDLRRTKFPKEHFMASWETFNGAWGIICLPG